MPRKIVRKKVELKAQLEIKRCLVQQDVIQEEIVL